MVWVVLFGLCLLLCCWGFWNDLSRPDLREVFSGLALGTSLLMSWMFAWVISRQFKPARMTLPWGFAATAQPIVDAAPRMRHTVERAESDEIVLRNDRSILGTHPTIVVRPLSDASLRVEGPESQVVRLVELLCGKRLSTDWQPSLLEVSIFLLVGLFMLATGVAIPFQGCAELEISTGMYVPIGRGMHRLCDTTGPLVPAAIGALIAMMPLAYSVAAWREYRRQRQATAS
jgi:hypothetical protein